LEAALYLSFSLTVTALMLILVIRLATMNLISTNNLINELNQFSFYEIDIFIDIFKIFDNILLGLPFFNLFQCLIYVMVLCRLRGAGRV
jgi:hypothetical protein